MYALYTQTPRSIGNSTEQGKANNIKNRILSDFYHHSDYSLYHNPYFDEPTYLSFRIAFTFENPSLNDNLNDMPMPLLELSEADKQEITDLSATPSLSYNSGLAGISNFTPRTELVYPKKTVYSNARYSTYNYLINQKESVRANYLNKFITKLQDIEYNYPFYFKSIEGISNLLKINTTSGRRLKDGENILTIKCLEGLDLKITELINLYKKIAWDDEYQRWILPDMMRYFQMKIYISEIRNFHRSKDSSLYTSKLKSIFGGNLGNRNSWGGQILNKLENTQIVNKAMSAYNDVKSAIQSFSGKATDNAFELVNHSINNYMPTLCITCNQCEFVIDDMMSNFGTFTSNNKTAVDDLTFKIKVGNIKESQYYPLYESTTSDPSSYTAIFDEELYRPTNQNWSSKDTELKKVVGPTQDRNYFGGNKFGTDYSTIDASYIVFDEVKRKGLLDSVVMEVADNAIDSVIGHIDQKATELLNKGLNTRLGNSNLTVQGMLNALNSKNILTMYSYVRDSVNAEMNTNAEIGSSATSSTSNLESMKFIKNDASALPLSEATLNSNDELDSSIRKKIKTEYQYLKNFADNSIGDSEATNDTSINLKVQNNSVKHSEIGDQAFIDFLKEVASLPISSATEDQKLAIEIAKIISDSDMNTKELDVFFEEAKVAEHEILTTLEKLEEENKNKKISSFEINTEKNKSDDINGYSDQQDNYKKLPKSEAVENKEKPVILFDEYTDLQAELRKLALSSATNPDIKVEALSLYSILKNYIDNSESSSQKVISGILDKNNLSNDDRKKIIELYEIAGREKDLTKLLESLIASSKNNEYNLLPKSEAVENLTSTNDMLKVEPIIVEKRNNIFRIENSNEIEKTNVIDGYSSQKDEYNNLPDSEAVENLTSTNDVFKVVVEDKSKNNNINGFEDLKDEYNNLPDSEAVENLTSTNDILTVDVEDKSKNNNINGFEDLKNVESTYKNNINGYSDLKTINNQPPISEATENLNDEMNSDKRNAIISEYSNLKNE